MNVEKEKKEIERSILRKVKGVHMGGKGRLLRIRRCIPLLDSLWKR